LDFGEKLPVLPGEEAGKNRYGEEIRESAEAKAERVVEGGLARAGWKEADLELRRKVDGLKVELARRLRRETTQGRLWSTKRLRMGHWRSAANAVAQKPEQ
jgi:hypothetical protein